MKQRVVKGWSGHFEASFAVPEVIDGDCWALRYQ